MLLGVAGSLSFIHILLHTNTHAPQQPAEIMGCFVAGYAYNQINCNTLQHTATHCNAHAPQQPAGIMG